MESMTPEEIAQLAQETSGASAAKPLPKALMWQRIDGRQRELFRVVAQVDPEFYGMCATVEVPSAGGIQIDLAQTVSSGDIAQIDAVYVKDTGSYAPHATTTLPNSQTPDPHRVVPGDRVTLCSAFDAAAHMPPRATVRDGILRPVGTDFQDDDGNRFAELDVFYQRLPQSILSDLTTPVDLAHPWDMLLVWDLARFLLSVQTDDSLTEEQQMALGAIAELEADMLTRYTDHVKSWSGTARATRFDGGI